MKEGTPIPVTFSRAEIQERMHKVEPQESYSQAISETLQETVFGQPEAADAVARRLALFDTGLSDPKRPLGSMVFLGPTGVGKCLHGKTPIYDPVDKTTKTVKKRYKEGKEFHVYALDANNNVVVAKTCAPHKFTKQKMWKVTFENGSSLSVTDGHRLFLGNRYSDVATLRQRLSSGEQVHLPSISAHDLAKLPLNAQHLSQTSANSQNGYPLLFCLCDQLLQRVKDSVQAFLQLLTDVLGLIPVYSQKGVGASKLKYNHQRLFFSRHATLSSVLLASNKTWVGFQHQLALISKQLFGVYYQPSLLFASDLIPQHKVDILNQCAADSNSSLDQVGLPPYLNDTKIESIKAIDKSYYYDFEVPQYNNYWAAGVFNHNTEMAHAAAKQMFGDTHSDRLKIINMAEMTREHYTARFVGSPPSYVGHSEKPEIPHDWLHKGRSIIVLDEFEKAHPDVRQLFLGALDKGSMNARNGSAGTQPLDFRNTMFIFTSNIGGQEMHDINNGSSGIGFKTGEPTTADKNKRISQVAEKGLKDTLSPEFLNRIDDVVVFHEITDPEIHGMIFDKFLAYRNHDLAETSEMMVRPNAETGAMERVSTAPQFYATDEFKQHILDTVANKGGREMKRELERQLFNKAADVFMGLDIKGMPLVADHDPDTGETVFYTDTEPPKAEGEKKDERVLLPAPTDGTQNGSPEPTSGTDSDGKQAGQETPPLEGEAGEEPKEPEGGESSIGPVDHYNGDAGDEAPGDRNNFPVIPELTPEEQEEVRRAADFVQGKNEAPRPPESPRIGIKILIWDENMVKDNGDITMAWLEHRNIKLPQE